MDYEKKYNEAVEKAKAINSGKYVDIPAEDTVLEYIFPELKESEDEKIRNGIIALIEFGLEDKSAIAPGHNITKEEAIAWLEKQKGCVYTADDIKTAEDHAFLAGADWQKEQNKKLQKQVEKPQGKSSLEAIKEEKVDNSNSVNIADEYTGLTDFERTLADVCIGWIGKEIGWKQYIKDNADVLLKIAIEKFNAIQDAPFDYEHATITQKDFAPKQEPKFHEGDWLCENEPNNYARFIHILETVNVQGKERYRISRDIHNDEDIVKFDFVEKYYHKFDIEDAKDGDVLAFDNETVVIFENLYNTTTFHSYCHIEDSVFTASDKDVPDWWVGKGFHPATKEQRDTLFTKMQEAGYEWDAEKKELKKIKEKPAKWSEEDEKIALSIEQVMNCASILNIVPEKIDKIKSWLKSLEGR